MFHEQNEKKERLLSDLALEKVKRWGDWSVGNPTITGIACHSKNVQNGDIFFALPGFQKHGARFVEDAAERGAKIIITDSEGIRLLKQTNWRGPMVEVDSPRKMLSIWSARWFGSQPEQQVAVTGTNGKTSVCNFVRQIWENLNYRGVNIGTMGVEGAVSYSLSHTTPDPITLHNILENLVNRKVTHVAMEASSHGLDQFRLDGVNIKAAAFTNLSRDHLDYHENEKSYFKSKCGLFDRIIESGGYAVINLDDPYGEEIRLLSKKRNLKVLTIGSRQNSDIQIQEHQIISTGQIIRFAYLGKEFTKKLNLFGAFQANNVLVAAALAISAGAEADQVFNSFSALKSVPGRMELVAFRNFGAQIFVDYAHTPQALARVLQDIRSHVIGKVLVVCGAGGDRDKGKRFLMGRVLSELADRIFITDDNPRNEEPGSIRAEILSGCPEAEEIGDRAKAIFTAIENLAFGDALIIAGKGHETGQTIGCDVLPFNDAEQASISVEILEGTNL